MDVTPEDQHGAHALAPSRGVSQTGVRAHNERLFLSLVRRNGSLSKAQIARRSGLSAQTVSVIMRALEKDGLLQRGAPVKGKGKIGKPSTPMALNPDGVYSIGLSIGRRSASLSLMDFVGKIRRKLNCAYPYPLPDEVSKFVGSGLDTLYADLSVEQQERIAGIGIAAPFELWNWLDTVGAADGKMDGWRDFNFPTEMARLTDLPVFIENDATSACSAEHTFGRGREFSDYIYFFVGYFVGGGVVLNHTIHSGRTGNAGALGSMSMRGPTGEDRQLIDYASTYVLETMLKDNGLEPGLCLGDLDKWQGFEIQLDEWVAQTGQYLARASVSACAVIDCKVVLIDGRFPPEVRARLVEETRRQMLTLDLRGIKSPQILEATIGTDARAIGAASLPLFSRYLVEPNSFVR